MLSFNEIAATIRTPGVFVEFDASRALPGPERLVLLGYIRPIPRFLEKRDDL